MLRQSDARFRAFKPNGVDGAVLGRRAFVLRYFADEFENERLLLVNFGKQDLFSPAPEPLLAPPDNHEWEMMWTSEAPEYGGTGMLPVNHDEGWSIFAEAAVALAVQVVGEPGSLDAGTEEVRRLGFKPDGTERIAAWA